MGKTNKAAKKANQTRAARRAFYRKYPETAAVAEEILRYESRNYRNWTTTAGYVTSARCAAIKANLNREGQYQDMALACNW